MKNILIFENEEIKVEESFFDSDELTITNKTNCLGGFNISKKDFEILYHQFKIHEINNNRR